MDDMYTEVYIDIIFLMNFFMDYILLRLIGTFFLIRRRQIRYWMAAGVGALFSCLLYMVPVQVGNRISFLLQGICAVLMLKLGLGLRKGSMLMKGILLLYLTSFLFGGFWEAVSEKKEYSLFAFVFLSTGIYYACIAGSLWVQCFRGRMQHRYSVTLFYENRKCELCAFYDSGNFLCDPVTGKPVSVVRAEALHTLLGSECIEKVKYIIVNPGELENTDLFRLKPHLVPFRSVGEQGGMLAAITLDELCIHTPKEEVRITSPVLALQYASSTLESEYELLLNSRLL